MAAEERGGEAGDNMGNHLQLVPGKRRPGGTRGGGAGPGHGGRGGERKGKKKRKRERKRRKGRKRRRGGEEEGESAAKGRRGEPMGGVGSGGRWGPAELWALRASG